MSVVIKERMAERALAGVENAVEQASLSIDQMLRGQIYSLSNLALQDQYLYRLLKEPYKGGPVEKQMDTMSMGENINSGYGRIYQNVEIAAVVGVNNTIYNLASPSYEPEELMSRIFQIRDEVRQLGSQVLWDGASINIFLREGNEQRDKRVILAAMNIFLPTDGEYLGVQIFAFPEELIYEKYQDSIVNQNGHMAVINAQSQIISETPVRRLKEQWFWEEIVILSKKPNQIVRSDGIIAVLGEPSPLNGWQVIGIVPIGFITHRVNSMFNIFGGIMTLCVGVCLAFFMLLSEAIIRPVRNIIDSMEKFEAGIMSPYVERKNKSELSKLEAYYNRMIDRINRHIVYEYEMDKQKKQLELDMLMSQINSHFLSNTLESIVWKARGAGSPETAKMASSLGRFFKLSSRKGNGFVTIYEEIQHACAYVDIQKLRYGNKLEFKLNIDEQLTKETKNQEKGINEYKTLKILLQPLVENAITHAMGPVNKSLEIKVSIHAQGPWIIFDVEDNGKGMSSEKVRELMEGDHNRKGIGIKNVRERIRLYFEDQFPSAGLKVESQKDKGTKIRLTLPKIKKSTG